MNAEERFARVSVHEAGHSLMAYLLTGCSGSAEVDRHGGGASHSPLKATNPELPDHLRTQSEAYWLAESLISVSGAVAEQLHYGKTATADHPVDAATLTRCLGALGRWHRHMAQSSENWRVFFTAASDDLLRPFTQELGHLGDRVRRKGLLRSDEIDHVVLMWPSLKGWSPLLVADAWPDQWYPFAEGVLDRWHDRQGRQGLAQRGERLLRQASGTREHKAILY
jgi:hypothetical protein